MADRVSPSEIRQIWRALRRPNACVFAQVGTTQHAETIVFLGRGDGSAWCGDVEVRGPASEGFPARA
jgi:hypothetical protein